ncbi:hypothetical protein AB0M47_05400 [Hamadaea sp. NPDC051192]|uniref:hypothetical protein n=1 Tax=Hamadaea sp. NPDC051192 TaxID=3154940 RepID=UPI00343257F3
MRKVLLVIAFVFGAYFIVRGIAELFVIDWSDSASYAKDWGGPSLAGVLLVHCGPAIVSAALMVWWFRRRSRARG